jgi:hypothetical protein
MASSVLTGVTLLLLFAVPFLPLGRAQQTFYPVAIPLAVRSPYLSCWLPLSNGSTWDRTLPTTSDLSQVCLFLQPRGTVLITSFPGSWLERSCACRQSHL